MGWSVLLRSFFDFLNPSYCKSEPVLARITRPAQTLTPAFSHASECLCASSLRIARVVVRFPPEQSMRVSPLWGLLSPVCAQPLLPTNLVGLSSFLRHLAPLLWAREWSSEFESVILRDVVIAERSRDVVPCIACTGRS